MTGRWLLLAHQLPTRPSNARVKTWRRLQQIGAVSSRNSVYVLPNTDQSREDFEWLRSEIVALGGEATVFSADAVSRGGGEEIVATFHRTRDAGYQELKRDAEKLLKAVRGRRPSSRPGAAAWEKSVRTLRERFTAIERLDFFRAPLRDAAEVSIAALERLTAGGKAAAARGAPASLSVADFRNRRWVTRPRPGVDRMASAWLIRRFVDPGATFAFVEQPPADADSARKRRRDKTPADVPFDMYIGEFSHQGPFCTYEVLAQRFALTDPLIELIGRIVHDLDLHDTKYGSAETPAVGRLVEGLRQLHADDQTLLQHGIEMFEALARGIISG